MQLNLGQMSPARREIYAHNGNGIVAGFRDGRIWLKFDNGWSALFSPEEVEPAVEQIGMFGAEVSVKR